MIILKTNLEAKDTNITTSLPYWNFEHADYASINAFLSNINWNNTFSNSITVERCWNSFSQILCDVFNRFIPVRLTSGSTSNSKRKPMRYPHYIRVMSKRKAILWKRLKVSNAPEDKALYKTVAGNCKNAIDKFHAAKELALVRKNNLGSFFQFY